MVSSLSMAPAPLTQPQDGPQIYTSWLDLPPEIRSKILDMVSQDYRDHRLDLYDKVCQDYRDHRLAVYDMVCQDYRDRSLALYATVCSEWQYFFEKITFRYLSVDNTVLEDFSRIMSGKNTHRTSNVRHLCFIIILPGYSCPSCHKLESWFEVYRNNRIFTIAMKKLLGILSTWVPRDCSGSLILELGIKSLSDTRHYYDDITLYNDYPFKSWDKLDEPVHMAIFHMNKSPRFDSRSWHFETSLLAVRRPEGFHATRRHLGSLLQFQGLKKSHLPRVEIINSLLMRHQFKRQICPLALAKLHHESLVCITSFRLERWCRVTTEEEEKYLKDFREHLLPGLLENLQSFHYFAENFKDINRSAPAQAKPLSAIELLCTHGHRLKEISVVGPYGTENWLAEMQFIPTNALTKSLLPAQWQWHKLERICFRSCILHYHNDLHLINRLLLLTAPVAENLPNLRSFEIFNTCANGHGQEFPSCLFRYSIQYSGAILLWESTWQLPLDTKIAEFEFCPQVKCAWEKAAVAHTGRGIAILINEPKKETSKEIYYRRYFAPRDKPQLAEGFELDPIHPFTRALMRVNYN